MNIHVEEELSQSYTAVFMVNTPPIGDSGLSHLAEHMVFRGSDAFPTSHELFVINSFLPASINASTQRGHTFFYLTAEQPALFCILLDYLYYGLVNLNYGNHELSAERDGVLTQELMMLENDPEYALQCAMWRGDFSKQAYSQIGGYSDTIITNRPEDVKHYKRVYYHSDHLSLYVSGPQFALAEMVWLKWRPSEALSKPFHDSIWKANKRILLPQPSHLGEDKTRVISWWIHQDYLVELKIHQQAIQSQMSDFGRIYIEDESNQYGQVALRLLTSDYSASVLQQAVVVLRTFHLNPSCKAFFDQKFPNEVNRLVYHFLRSQPSTTRVCEPFCEYLNTYTISEFNPIPQQDINDHDSEIELIDVGVLFKNDDSTIASLHRSLLSIEYSPALPKFFDPLLSTFSEGAKFAHNTYHWLYKLDKSEQSRLLSIATQSHFWGPRLLGQCYAMGLGHSQQQYYLYGAQDRHAAERQNWCEQQFMSISV